MRIGHFFATLVTIIIFLSFYTLWQVFWISADEALPAVSFEVADGSSLAQVGADLKEQGIIGNEFLFKMYAKFKNADTKIRSGFFLLRPGSSISDVLSALTIAQMKDDREITTLEGWSVREIGDYLASEGIADTREFLELVGFPAQTAPGFESEFVTSLRDEYSFLESKPDTVGLEGYLFPDTYRIYLDATLPDIVRKMLDNFDSKLTVEMRSEIKRQGKTVHEVITMASIIEREARGLEDQKQVSDIFWRRLSEGMPLETCSSVNYITGKNDPAVTLEDRDIDSPFNTYLYPGLPPGPIANPGMSAIEAAIFPTANDYWYFLTDEEGNMHYATTYDEHISNKAIYLR